MPRLVHHVDPPVLHAVGIAVTRPDTQRPLWRPSHGFIVNHSLRTALEGHHAAYSSNKNPKMFHSCLFLVLDMLTADKGTHNFSYCQILLKKSVDFLAIPYIYCTFAVMLDAESSHLLETTPVVPDDVHWYPMRVTYQRVKAIKTLLDADHVENFLPMHWVWQEKKDGQRELNHRPLIASMIFVRDTRDHIIKLK